MSPEVILALMYYDAAVRLIRMIGGVNPRYAGQRYLRPRVPSQILMEM